LHACLLERRFSQATTGTTIYRPTLRRGNNLGPRICSGSQWKEAHNILMERLKLVFTAQQEEQAINKSCAVQSSMEPPSSRKLHSILKSYPSASQLKNKKTVILQKE